LPPLLLFLLLPSPCNWAASVLLHSGPTHPRVCYLIGCLSKCRQLGFLPSMRDTPIKEAGPLFLPSFRFYQAR
jgi:hypothetical protein